MKLPHTGKPELSYHMLSNHNYDQMMLNIDTVLARFMPKNVKKKRKEKHSHPLFYGLEKMTAATVTREEKVSNDLDEIPEIIRDVFTSEHPMTIIEQHRSILKRVIKPGAKRAHPLFPDYEFDDFSTKWTRCTG
jgi:hypothetical protein